MLGAREELKILFRDEELPFWGVCHPSPVARRALDAHQPPPSAGTYGLHGYERLSAELREVVKELICFVGKGVDEIFCSQDTLHNTEESAAQAVCPQQKNLVEVKMKRSTNRLSQGTTLSHKHHIHRPVCVARIPVGVPTLLHARL